MPSSLHRVIGRNLAMRFEGQQRECQEWDISERFNKERIGMKEEAACRQ
jgi:hypothetical protein